MSFNVIDSSNNHLGYVADVFPFSLNLINEETYRGLIYVAILSDYRVEDLGLYYEKINSYYREIYSSEKDKDYYDKSYLKRIEDISRFYGIEELTLEEKIRFKYVKDNWRKELLNKNMANQLKRHILINPKTSIIRDNKIIVNNEIDNKNITENNVLISLVNNQKININLKENIQNQLYYETQLELLSGNVNFGLVLRYPITHAKKGDLAYLSYNEKCLKSIDLNNYVYKL